MILCCAIVEHPMLLIGGILLMLAGACENK